MVVLAVGADDENMDTASKTQDTTGRYLKIKFGSEWSCHASRIHSSLEEEDGVVDFGEVLACRFCCIMS
jgi:hypothetical protein